MCSCSLTRLQATSICASRLDISIEHACASGTMVDALRKFLLLGLHASIAKMTSLENHQNGCVAQK